MRMNKKGTDKYLSPFWFLIITVVAGAVFSMVYIFYGTPYDIRNLESNVLLNNVADCVSYAGRINVNLISNGTNTFQKSGADFLKYCHLNFDTTEWSEEQYYTEINFYKINDLNDLVLNIKAGNNNWIADCEIQANKPQENLLQKAEKLLNSPDLTNNPYATFPQCVKKSFYSVDNSNNQYIIKILTIVRKSEKNVKE